MKLVQFKDGRFGIRKFVFGISEEWGRKWWNFKTSTCLDRWLTDRFMPVTPELIRTDEAEARRVFELLTDKGCRPKKVLQTAEQKSWASKYIELEAEIAKLREDRRQYSDLTLQLQSEVENLKREIGLKVAFIKGQHDVIAKKELENVYLREGAIVSARRINDLERTRTKKRRKP